MTKKVLILTAVDVASGAFRAELEAALADDGVTSIALDLSGLPPGTILDGSISCFGDSTVVGPTSVELLSMLGVGRDDPKPVTPDYFRHDPTKQHRGRRRR